MHPNYNITFNFPQKKPFKVQNEGPPVDFFFSSEKKNTEAFVKRKMILEYS